MKMSGSPGTARFSCLLETRTSVAAAMVADTSCTPSDRSRYSRHSSSSSISSNGRLSFSICDMKEEEIQRDCIMEAGQQTDLCPALLAV